MQRNAMLSMFAPAPTPPNERWKFAAVFLALLAFVLMPILICLAADDADARARTANAKVVFESNDQAVLPDAAPNINLNIRKQGTPAPSVPEFDPLSASVLVDVHGDNACFGSGTIIKAGVLTSAHLFTEGDGTTTITIDLRGEKVPAIVKKINFDSDLALLECKWQTSPTPAELGENIPAVKTAKDMGRLLVSINTCGRGKSGILDKTTHKISGIRQTLSGDITEILYDPPPFPGRSGGGMFNSSGELIGVVSAYDEEGTGIAIAINQIHGLLAGKDAPRRVVVASMKSCGPCNALKSRSGKGDSDLLIVYADIESPERPPLVTESEWQWIMASIADGQGVPFATWLPKGANEPVRLPVSGMDSRTILHNLNYFDNEANR